MRWGKKTTQQVFRVEKGDPAGIWVGVKKKTREVFLVENRLRRDLGCKKRSSRDLGVEKKKKKTREVFWGGEKKKDWGGDASVSAPEFPGGFLSSAAGTEQLGSFILKEILEGQSMQRVRKAWL